MSHNKIKKPKDKDKKKKRKITLRDKRRNESLAMGEGY